MEKYYCDCCGRSLEDSEVNFLWDDSLDEIYVSCKYCGSDCFDCDRDEEEEAEAKEDTEEEAEEEGEKDDEESDSEG